IVIARGARTDPLQPPVLPPLAKVSMKAAHRRLPSVGRPAEISRGSLLGVSSGTVRGRVIRRALAIRNASGPVNLRWWLFRKWMEMSFTVRGMAALHSGQDKCGSFRL